MNNKYTLWAIGVIAAVAIIGDIIYKNNVRQKEAAPQEETQSPERRRGEAPKAEAGLTYQQVVEMYKDHRVAFNPPCGANPTSMTVKTGTRVMFDNRSEETRKITIDGRAYTIGPNGFIILTMTASALPHTVKIDCDSQYNVANILIQK